MFDSVMGVLSTDLPDPDSVPTTDLVRTATELHRLEAAVCARKHAFAAAVLDRFDDGTYAGPLDPAGVVGPWDLAEAELSAALTVTGAGASALIAVGHALRTRLPNVWTMFARGELDLYRVKAIVHATANVDPELIKEVETRILAALTGARLTGRRLRTVVDRIIAEVDAEGLRRRRRQATRDRHVEIHNAADGMAELSGSLPAPEAVELTGRLGEMAKGVCAADPRSFAARRADALIALARGEARLVCRCGRSECPHTQAGEPGAGVARRALVHVIATRDTLAGYSDVPGWLDGYGIIDADQVRSVAADATIRPVYRPGTETPPATDRASADRAPAADADRGHEPGRAHESGRGYGFGCGDGAGGPVPTSGGGAGVAGGTGAACGAGVGGAGYVDSSPDRAEAGSGGRDPGELRYRPSRSVQDYVRALFGSCMFPTCDAPVWDCDLDHRDAFDHENPEAGGRTVSWNLGPFCRAHHNGKTHGGWVLTRHPDGGYTITSPLGFVYPVPDTGPLTLLGGAGFERGDPATSPMQPKPKQRSRIQQRQDRVRRERARNRDDNADPPPF